MPGKAEVLRLIAELRRFRHAFRHIYDTPLDQRKLMIAQEDVRPAVEGVRKAHTALIAKLNELSSELEL